MWLSVFKFIGYVLLALICAPFAAVAAVLIVFLTWVLLYVTCYLLLPSDWLGAIFDGDSLFVQICWRLYAGFVWLGFILYFYCDVFDVNPRMDNFNMRNYRRSSQPDLL